MPFDDAPNHADVLVLGAGPGGYVAAIRAAQLGLSVVIIEGRWWGGVCLNVGCIPTKALLRNAEVADLVTRQGGAFGLTGDLHVDYATGWKRSRDVASRMSDGVRFLMKKNSIRAVEGWGKFTGPHTVEVQQSDGATTTWSFDHAIIATGATPKVLPGMTVDDRVMTYEQLITADHLPNSLVVAGSGAIGVEFATIAAAFGTDVTIVEYLDRLAPNEDEAVSAELARAFRKRGIKSMTGTAVRHVQQSEDGVIVDVAPAGGGEGTTIRADALLLALGFAPRTDGFGLEQTGVSPNGNGFIDVDHEMRTSVPHVFAIGDVTGKMMLAHVAERQGVIAAETIAGKHPMPLDYDSVPRATYCEPQIGSVGLTKAQAEAEGYSVKVSRFPFAANGKAQSLGESAGFVMLVADAETGLMLGAHMVGPDVTELLPELVLAKTWGLTMEQLAITIHAHPSLSEAVMEAAEGISGTAIDV